MSGLLGAPGPEQLHRHDESVIHRQFLARGNVKFVGDHAFDDVPAKFGRHQGKAAVRGQAPAFVLIAVFMGRADGKGRHPVQEKPKPVVVIDVYHIVGFVRLDPFVNLGIAVKERLPIGIVIKLVLDRIADGRDMGCSNPAKNLSPLSRPPSGLAQQEFLELFGGFDTGLQWPPTSCTDSLKMPASFAR